MSTTTARPLGGSRLPSRPSNRTERRRELRTAVLAVLGLLVVLVGVPAALVLTVGNPLPTEPPSRAWLTAQITTDAVLRVLASALWIAWAHFAVCVLAEWKAARRGSGLASDVPLGGGSQLLARKLIASALLLAGAATLVPGASAASSGPAPARAEVSITAVQAEAAPPPAVQAETPPATVATGPAKTYVVQPPDGRRYDSLWDIAERTLGDPFRYKEVFELNRNRVQDDGRKLLDANLIHPGWVLQMPADASGPGVSTPALAPPPQRPAPDQPAPAPHDGPVTEAVQEVGTAPAGGLTTERALFGGGLLAAGVLLALSARRGPFGRATSEEVEQQLRLAAAPGRAGLLDRALRTLSARCAETGLPLPEIAVAYVDDTQVTLSLVGLPGAPPAPWSVVSDGRGWTVRAEDVPTEAPDAPAPYPALAGIALSDGSDLLVDLEAAPGLIALEGDPLVAREVASSLVVELATNTWSDGVRVTVVGFGDDLTDLAPEAVTTADTLAEVLDGLEQESRASREALRALGVDGVLSGRLVRSADRTRPRVVVLSGPPTPEEAARLHVLVADVRTPLAVLCVGTSTAARWRFTVDVAGELDLGLLGVTGTARRLSRAGYLPLLELLRGADAERAAAAATLGSLSPRAALEEVTGAGAAAPLPASAPRPAPARMPHGPAAVSVRLLGPVEVVAPGPVDEAARPLLTEIVVAAALHREGLHEAVLRSEVWPRGVGDDVLAAAVAQAQAWLGTAADGQPRLRRDAQGRYALSPDVHLDWDVLQACAAAADGPAELPSLLQGLAQVRGEAFSGTPGDRFGSMAFHRAARDARVVGTAVARRAAGLALGAGDRPTAERALRTGLTLVPTAEPLWRDLLRLVGPGPEAGTVATDAYAALAARRLPPEPETDALVQQLAPGVVRRRA